MGSVIKLKSLLFQQAFCFNIPLKHVNPRRFNCAAHHLGYGLLDNGLYSIYIVFTGMYSPGRHIAGIHLQQ